MEPSGTGEPVETWEADKDAVARIEGIRFNSLSNQSITNYYDKWTEFYDKDTASRDYTGPRYTAEGLAKIIVKTRDSARILDVAAGTGLVGEQLAKLGFKNIDALEPSSKSLEVAKKKGIYTKFFHTLIDDRRLDIPDGTYDGVTVSGATIEGHLPAKALYEIFRVLKPGGCFCLVGNTKCFDGLEEYNIHMRRIMNNLEEKGKWQKLEETIRDGYYRMDTVENCYRFIFRKK